MSSVQVRPPPLIQIPLPRKLYSKRGKGILNFAGVAAGFMSVSTQCFSTWIDVSRHGSMFLDMDRSRIQTGTIVHKRTTARFLQFMLSKSTFSRQLVQSGIADYDQLVELRQAFESWENDPASFAAEAWTEAIATKS